MLEVLELEDLTAPGALSTSWSLLEVVHANMAHERAYDAYAKWETAHRRHGQPMGEWVTHIHTCKWEMDAQDLDINVSQRQLASKMLRESGLPQEKNAQVLYNCGGLYDPQRTETVLRATFPRLGDVQRKFGHVKPHRDHSKRTNTS